MRRIEAYKVKRNDNLASPDYWNGRFEDIDLRLAARESDADTIANALNTVETLALMRMNDVFTPLIIEAQEALNSFGISFNGLSTTPVTVGTGQKTFTLTEGSRAGFYYADYVSLRSASEPTANMLGQVLSYSRQTGILVVDVVAITGSGSHADWNVRLGSPPDSTHASRTDNPHSVTAEQVGAYTENETDVAIAAAVAAAVDALPETVDALAKAANLSDLNNVITARGNLGLGFLAVENEVGTGMFASSVRSTQAQALAGTDNVTLMTPLRVAQAFAASGNATIDGGTF